MKFILSGCFFLMFVCVGQAWDLSLGIGAYVEKSPYKEVDWTVIPMPMVQFESKYVFFDIQTAGVYLYKSDTSALMLLADYIPLSYEPDDSDDVAMKLIDGRDATIMTGIRYVIWGAYGIAKIDYMVDILGESDGQRARLSYGLYFSPAGFDIMPEIGVIWHSGWFNDYYFGISQEEALASGFSAYKAYDSFTPYLALSVQYKFTDHFKMLMSSTCKYIPDEVTSSPLTEDNYGLSVLAGLSYIF